MPQAAQRMPPQPYYTVVSALPAGPLHARDGSNELIEFGHSQTRNFSGGGVLGSKFSRHLWIKTFKSLEPKWVCYYIYICGASSVSHLLYIITNNHNQQQQQQQQLRKPKLLMMLIFSWCT